MVRGDTPSATASRLNCSSHCSKLSPRWQEARCAWADEAANIAAIIPAMITTRFIERLVRLVLVIAEMIGAEHVGVAHRRRGADIRLVELPHALAAHQAEIAADLVLQQLQHPHDAGPS